MAAAFLSVLSLPLQYPPCFRAVWTPRSRRPPFHLADALKRIGNARGMIRQHKFIEKIFATLVATKSEQATEARMLDDGGQPMVVRRLIAKRVIDLTVAGESQPSEIAAKALSTLGIKPHTD